jgi:hypothetical protein
MQVAIAIHTTILFVMAAVLLLLIAKYGVPDDE